MKKSEKKLTVKDCAYEISNLCDYAISHLACHEYGEAVSDIKKIRTFAMRIVIIEDTR